MSALSASTTASLSGLLTSVGILKEWIIKTWLRNVNFYLLLLIGPISKMFAPLIISLAFSAKILPEPTKNFVHLKKSYLFVQIDTMLKTRLLFICLKRGKSASFVLAQKNISLLYLLNQSNQIKSEGNNFCASAT